MLKLVYWVILEARIAPLILTHVTRIMITILSPVYQPIMRGEQVMAWV